MRCQRREVSKIVGYRKGIVFGFRPMIVQVECVRKMESGESLTIVVECKYDAC